MNQDAASRNPGPDWAAIVAHAYAAGMRPALTPHLEAGLRERVAQALAGGGAPDPDRVNRGLEAWERETGIVGPRCIAVEAESATVRMTQPADAEHPRRPFGGQ